MDPVYAAAQQLVSRFKETTAVHDEVSALESALAGEPAPAAANAPAVTVPTGTSGTADGSQENAGQPADGATNGAATTTT